MTKDVNVHGQFREFVATVVANLPDIPSPIMQEWINNPKGLKKALKAAFFYFKVWKTIKVAWVVSAGGFNKLYSTRGIYFDALAERMLNKINYDTRVVSEIDLVIVTPSMLEFKEKVNYYEFIKKAQEIGFKICPINTGPYLIMEFPFSNDNKEEDHLHIAMRPLYDNYCKEEYIFGIKKSEIFGELTLEGTEVKGNEKVWNPDSKFVFCLPLIRS